MDVLDLSPTWLAIAIECIKQYGQDWAQSLACAIWQNEARRRFDREDYTKVGRQGYGRSLTREVSCSLVSLRAIVSRNDPSKHAPENRRRKGVADPRLCDCARVWLFRREYRPPSLACEGTGPWWLCNPPGGQTVSRCCGALFPHLSRR
jgi:hypothetical protein